MKGLVIALFIASLCASQLAIAQDPDAAPQPGIDENWQQPVLTQPPLVTEEPKEEKKEPPKDAPKVETPAQVQQPPPASEEEHVHPGVRFQLNGGLGFFSVPARNVTSVGLFGDAVTAFRMNDFFSFRLRLGIAASEFERTVAMWNAAIAVGGWTAGAYVSVTNWWTTGDPKWGLFKFMGAVVAYVGLSLGFVVSGLLFILSPIAAASFIETGPSFAVHYTQGVLDLYAEAGVGGMLYAVNAVGADVGWGPVVGAGMRIGPIGVGIHVLWSPAEFNGARGSIFGGGATVSAGY